MDINQIMISLGFVYMYKDSKDATTEYRTVNIEIIVNRDITLNTLIDGIGNGLAGKCNITKYIFKIDKYDSTKQPGIKIDTKEFTDCTEEEKTALCYYIFLNCIGTDKDEDVSNARCLIANPYTEMKIVNFTENGDKTLNQLDFVTSSRLVFDISGKVKVECLIKKDPKPKNFPEYNISTRTTYILNTEPYKIIPPSEPPKKNGQNIVMAILSPILMMAGLVFARSFMGQGMSNKSMLAMTIITSSTSVIISVIGILYYLREFRLNLDQWKDRYEKYIKQTMEDIEFRQGTDIELLNLLYPTVNDLVNETGSISGDIFSRTKDHPDFLSVRVGTAPKDDETFLVDSVFKIIGEKKEEVFSTVSYENLSIDNFKIKLNDTSPPHLYNLPEEIANKYAHLKAAPVVLRFLNCGALGIVYGDQKQNFNSLIESIIFQLCYYHSPDDLQFVMFCNSSDSRETVKKYKFLPHFLELFEDTSPFVFARADATVIMNKLLEILTKRKDNKDKKDDAKEPHIIAFIEEEYDIKRHGISEFLPESPEKGKAINSYGVTFVFCKKVYEELPKYCAYVISAFDNAFLLVPHTLTKPLNERISFEGKGGLWEKLKIFFGVQIKNSPKSRYLFMNDVTTKIINNQETSISNDERKENAKKLTEAFGILSALYYLRIAQNADIPAFVDLSDIYLSDSSRFSINIATFWHGKDRYANVTKSLSVPIGRNERDNVELDLHEAHDGPHMLVAGTTGSGKSETILTYLIGLCIRFTPDEVNLLLVDMKGGGFVKRIGDLPHVVGKVTDVDGDENGMGSVYMLKRFLSSLNAEITRRKLLFNQMEVDSIDEYIKAYRNIDDHINNKLKLSPTTDANRIAKIKKLIVDCEALAHLFLVVDEFTELKRFSQENDEIDFIKEITTIARVGRSLGFHIILISQNIEGAITDDIRVNSKARLCLKVATRAASRDMIGSDAAASPHMPDRGRAYLLIGTGSRFEYFQSAYSASDITKRIDKRVVITTVSESGSYTNLYDSGDNSETGKIGETQLQCAVTTICGYFKTMKMRTPRIIFSPPLSKRYVLDETGVPKEV